MRRQGDRGAALVVVMLVMLSLLGIGMTALWLTNGNLTVAANTDLRMQAFYTAEAGIARAVAQFNQANGPVLNDVLRGFSAGKDNVPTALDASGRPNGVGAVLIDGTTALWQIPYPPATFNRTATVGGRPSPQLMGTYTVWVRNDPADCRRGSFTVDTNGAVVVRSQGVARDGRTTVVLEVTVNPATVVPGPTPRGGPVLCMHGKNACDDNSSVQYGVVYE